MTGENPSDARAVPGAPRWFRVLFTWGVGLLRPFLPSAWIDRLEHAAWFVFIGTLNTGLGYVLFVLFLNLFGLGRGTALLLAYLIGMAISYRNFKTLVFGAARDRHAPLRFVCASLLLYACNKLLLDGLVHLSGLGEEVSQFLLLPVVALLSYVFNKYLVFRP